MDLELSLHDSLSRQRVAVPRRDGPVALYACGPTVYNFQHIGNFRKFLFDDLLVRALRSLGYGVEHVMNITDVGHLTDDGDAGEDKMELAVRREQVDVEAIIARYTDVFLEDWRALRISEPGVMPRASRYVDDQVALVKALVDKGHAYDTPEGVYFDVTTFPGYGALTGQDMAERVVGAREEVVTETSKRHPADFAVWLKTVGKYKNAIQKWDSPWGVGFPGWHLECSALAHRFLPHPLDIHTGGVDHLFPHHTNEIAQSEAAYGAPFAKAWVHSEHILADDEKMSKSLGNVYLLKDLVARGFFPLDYRYLVLSSHYRTRFNFTFDALAAAKAGRRGLLAAYWDAGDVTGARDERLMQAFHEALADDLGSPRALALAHEAAALPREARKATLEAMDAVLQVLDAMPEIPAEVKELAAKREEARANKQFVQSDALRAEIAGLGWDVQDSPAGPRLSPLP